ncbi:hypothetical protein WV34_05935 [Bacillus amyloliquefaciens]|nr:hypothetical protein WV34_05935 [Bacillus amyloliquefaciens]
MKQTKALGVSYKGFVLLFLAVTSRPSAQLRMLFLSAAIDALPLFYYPLFIKQQAIRQGRQV